MRTTIRHLLTLAVLVPVVTTVGVGDEPLTRVQIARIGKAATALVEVKAQRSHVTGTGFCIHPAGWFLTTAHVAQGELTLVLNAGLKTEKSYSARIVRSDTELDLALLRVEGVKDLPALALGTDEGLEELAEVVAFGYPFGAALREISVNPGPISALRHNKDGQLQRIQLAAVLNPGNSGGPVLDSTGKVVGVAAAGFAGVNSAIPVSIVSRFLSRPEVQFSPPRLGSAELHKPVQFEARVTPLLPSPAPLTVDLILKAGGGQERTARMDADGDRYRLTAVPFPGPSGPVTLRLDARFEEGSLEATSTALTFTVGGRKVALADVRTIWPGSAARVSLGNGTIMTGALSGLDAVSVPVGKQTLSLRLDRAKVVEVTPVGQIERVACTLVVRQTEKEIYRQSESLGTPDSLKMVEASQYRGHGGPINGLAAPDTAAGDLVYDETFDPPRHALYIAETKEGRYFVEQGVYVTEKFPGHPTSGGYHRFGPPVDELAFSVRCRAEQFAWGFVFRGRDVENTGSELVFFIEPDGTWRLSRSTHGVELRLAGSHGPIPELAQGRWFNLFVQSVGTVTVVRVNDKPLCRVEEKAPIPGRPAAKILGIGGWWKTDERARFEIDHVIIWQVARGSVAP
jgi:hypothetical protein